MTLSGTYDHVLTPEVNNLIDAVLVRTGAYPAIGPYEIDDVRQHLREIACRLALRYDGRAKFTTWIYRRLHGAVLDLMKLHGTRDRHGDIRPLSVPFDVAISVDSGKAGEADAGVPLVAELIQEPESGETEGQADMTLAISRLPDRQRLALYYLFYESLEPREAADRLRMPEEALLEMRDSALLRLRFSLLE